MLIREGVFELVAGEPACIAGADEPIRRGGVNEPTITICRNAAACL